MLVMSKNSTIRRRSLYFTSLVSRGDLAGSHRFDGRRGRRLGRLVSHGRGPCGERRFRLRGLFQFLKLKDADILLLAVFGDGEIARLQAFTGWPSCLLP